MRKILFRGKPKHSEEYYFFSQNWKAFCKNGFVFGSLIVKAGKYYICVSAMRNMTTCINNGMTSMIEVIPETVGQYINLDDEDNKEIFEGDILKNIWTGDIHTVNWCVDCAVWVLPCVTDERRETTFNSYSSNEYVIIGNVFDNPELLKGGEPNA